MVVRTSRWYRRSKLAQVAETGRLAGRKRALCVSATGSGLGCSTHSGVEPARAEATKIGVAGAAKIPCVKGSGRVEGLRVEGLKDVVSTAAAVAAPPISRVAVDPDPDSEPEPDPDD